MSPLWFRCDLSQRFCKRPRRQAAAKRKRRQAAALQNLIFVDKMSILACKESIFRCKVSIFGCKGSIFRCKATIFRCKEPILACKVSIFQCKVSILACKMATSTPSNREMLSKTHFFARKGVDWCYDAPVFEPLCRTRAVVP